MMRQALTGLICVILLPTGGVLAAAGGHEGAGSESPGIFAGDLFTALFTVVLFVVLLIILSKWAWNPILSGLQKREEHIRQTIEDAGKARSEAEKSLQEYKDKLAAAQQESKEIIEKGRSEAVKIAEELKQKAQEEAREWRRQAERDIVSAKNEAVREISQQAIVLATDLAGKIVQKSLNPKDHYELLQDSLSKIQQKGGY